MKRTYPIGYVILAILLVGVTAFGITQWREKNDYRLQMSNAHRRSLYQTAVYIGDLEKQLTKAQLARDAKQCAPIFADIWRQAGAAHDSLSTLSYNHDSIAPALQFLSQTSDVSYELMSKAIDGQSLDNDDWKKVNELKNVSVALSNDFSAMQAEADSEESLHGFMVAVDQTRGSTRSVISSESFSDPSEDFAPFITAGQTEITKEEGTETVKSFLKNFQIMDILYTGTTDQAVNAGIPVYSYVVCLAGYSEPTVSIDISREGGFPVWMLDYTEQPFSENRLTPKSAITVAQKFLTDNGYFDMKSHYYETYENSCFVHFVYEKDGRVYYPDMIKVKVSLTDGRVIGFEATDYLTSHRVRPLEEPKLAQWQAAELVSSQFKVKKAGLAVISLSDGQERLCYEFEGDFDGEQFLIYINADNGKQEKILQWIENEHGALVR